MTTEQIHNESTRAALRILVQCCNNEVHYNDYKFVTNTIENLMLRVQRETDQAREDGEQLAYNCEKQVKKKMIEKACHALADILSRDMLLKLRKIMEE